MKRFRVYLILALIFFLLIIMPFSIVQGDSPVIVQNEATMIKPYETGYADTYENEANRRDAEARADYIVSEGIAYASAFASEYSNSWAYSYLQDSFEIIHSSNYDITLSFNYKGLVKIGGIADFGAANAKVELTFFLIDRTDGEIISQENETIADFAQFDFKVDIQLGHGVVKTQVVG